MPSKSGWILVASGLLSSSCAKIPRISSYCRRMSTLIPERKNVVIVSGVRTPIGSFKGVLKSRSAVDLGAVVIREAYERAGLCPEEIDNVYFGHVLQANCRQAPVRQAALAAGLPTSTECTAVNKLCASGLKAIMIGCQSVLLGDESIVVAGGMESMSRAPFLLPRETLTYGGQFLADSIVYDGLTCAINNIHMGSCTERLAKRIGISRQEQDEFAIVSYERSLYAIKSGSFKNEIVPCVFGDGKKSISVDTDEEPARFVKEKISKLKPAFEADGAITPANASKLSDGAAAVLLMTEEEANKRQLKPLARIVAFADGATDPVDFGIAPAISTKRALKKANLSTEDISLFEINEAFSAVTLANMKELQLDSAKVNVHGGAVSLGHPVGMSGARIIVHLAHSLKEGQFGLAAICNGGGGSSAMIIQKP